MKVSIITISYNSENTILKTIESVNQQTYEDVEHIFIDGKSEDDTLDIIKKYSVRENKIISEKDHGIYNAMNKGIKHSTGEIIGFLNSDDYFFTENSLKTIINHFNNNQCVYGNLHFINNKNKIVRKWISSPFQSGLFKYSWTPAHPTFYCLKELYNK